MAVVITLVLHQVQDQMEVLVVVADIQIKQVDQETHLLLVPLKVILEEQQAQQIVVLVVEVLELLEAHHLTVQQELVVLD